MSAIGPKTDWLRCPLFSWYQGQSGRDAHTAGCPLLTQSRH
jgi:hypothetical protein